MPVIVTNINRLTLMSNNYLYESQCLELFTEIVAAYPLPAGTATYAVPFNVPQDYVLASDITLSFTGQDDKPHSSIADAASHSTTASLKSVLPYLRHFIKDAIISDAIISDDAHDARMEYQVVIDDKLTVHSLTKRNMAGLYYLITLSANTVDDPLKLTLMQRDLDAAGAFDVIFEDENGRLYLARTISPCAKMNVTFNLPRDKHSTVEVTLTSPNPLLPITDANTD